MKTSWVGIQKVKSIEMGWMPLSPDGVAMCQPRGVEAQAIEEGIHGKNTIIGVDLAKNVHQVQRA
jgi:hypothetical protein